MKKILLSISIIILSFSLTLQTDAAWEKEMESFKKQDQQNPPQLGQILFVGSSTFTLWKTMQDDMPEIPLINRGFGGSKVTDLIEHFDTVIAPYHPKQIVIYEGDNDIVSGASPKKILENYKQSMLCIFWENEIKIIRTEHITRTKYTKVMFHILRYLVQIFWNQLVELGKRFCQQLFFGLSISVRFIAQVIGKCFIVNIFP